MRTFDHTGVQIAFRDEGDGPTLLFLHNGGTSSTIWRHQVRDLQDRYRTIAVDLPGFGASPRAGRCADLDLHVELVAALLDELDAGPAVVVGNCMGSNIACSLADARPDLVRGLVLVNPLTERTFSHGWLAPLHRMARIAPGPTRAVRRASRHLVLPGPVASATVRFQIGTKGARLGLHRDPHLIADARRRDQLPALVDVLDDLDAYGALDRRSRRLDVPIVVVWGAQNRVLSPAAGEALDQHLAPRERTVLEGCGHLPMLEDADAVTELIDRFTASVADEALAGTDAS